jgi:hypothetical protein
VPAPDNLGIAVIGTGGAGEPELAEPVRALRQASARTELLSLKRPGGIAAFTRQILNLFAAARGRDGNFPCDSRCCGHSCRCISGDLLGVGRDRAYRGFLLNAGGQLVVSIQAHSDYEPLQRQEPATWWA